MSLSLMLNLASDSLAAGPLQWQMGSGFRSAPLNVPASGKIGFTKLEGSVTGILFTNRLSDDRSVRNRNLLSGSGVACGDVDGDGLCDLYFCGLDNHNVLYRNLGNWKFEDITASAGVACENQDSTGAVLVDIDGDGDLDLIVNSLGGGTRVFENDGKGHFKEITEQAGVRSKTGSMSMALADIDGDGDLDLYVVNYRPTSITDQPSTTFRLQPVGHQTLVTAVNGQPTTLPELTNRFSITPAGEVLEMGEEDVLYVNDGKGHFTPVSFTHGAFLDEDGQILREPPRDWGLSAQFHDLNGDGAPDLYVCNDLFSIDRIWLNDGKGHFRALPKLALRNTSTFSMGVDFADLDRDGHVDFFVVDMLSRDHQKRHLQVGGWTPVPWPLGLLDNRPQVPHNTLQLNRGDTTFAETSYYSGVAASEWSWCPIFLDVDLDGYEDLLISTGQLRDFQNMDAAMRLEASRANRRISAAELAKLMKELPGVQSPNLIFRNRGDLTFEEVGARWGFATVASSQGMALADLDNDGDLDVVVNCLNSGAGIYRNDTSAPRLAVRLKGAPPNTQGIGGKITVNGGPVTQSQEIISGGRYLSGDDPMRVFAAGSLTNKLTITVIWRSGKRSVVDEALPNRIYEINEAQASENSGPAAGAKVSSEGSVPPESEEPRFTTPLFQDVSSLLRHAHVEEPFDDFERQPLLPNRLSQLGPGIAWHDLDGDGWDDLFIAGGRGGKLALFRNNGQGGFRPMDYPGNQAATRDQTTVLGYGQMLLLGSANYEDGLTNGPAVRLLAPIQNQADDSLPGQLSSTGPLALADIDGDGDLDLFVGGRVVPGRYPEPATSLLLHNEGGRFVLAQKLEKIGLVSGAVFSDLDGDGFPELVLACDWGPLRVFHNDHGQFREITQDLGLTEYRGWWHGVTAGDVDGDGKLDLIASNWGLNSQYILTPGHARQLYYGDFADDGRESLVETYFDEAMGKEVPERGLKVVAAAIPWVMQKVGTFEKYGGLSANEIYGDRLRQAGRVEVSTFRSMVFFNRGKRFEPVPLPREAQLAPAFGVCIGDCDGDGVEDIFLSQNFFAVPPDASRCDAGRGLWLRGVGNGQLKALPGQESGVMVYGEQRGCALADYDGDGRVDLVVTQNANQTRLFHNVGGRPGLRVRLKGPPGNPSGVGAVMRLKFGEAFGPAREIHAGSGYWSQDSAVQVLGMPRPPSHIWIRWPGGKETISALTKPAREIAVQPDGKLEVLR